jgi:NitT/TauT family transport system substrate-binding protein
VRLRFRFGRPAAVAAALVAAVAVAGCGGDDSSSDANAGAAGGVTTLKLGYVPYADDAPAFLAQEKGIFRKHGVNLEFVPAPNPVAAVAALTSGKQQLAFVTDPVLINANLQNTKLKCVAPVVGRQPADTARDGTTLIAGKDSGIKGVRDLAGKKVAMVQLNSLNSLDVQVLAQRAGIDYKSVQLIQMPFPQMPAALDQGRVQAAIIVQPFAQTAIDKGHTVINHPNAELWPGGTTVCFAALAEYIDENPEVIKGFNAAMRESITYTKDHESEAKATLAKYMELTPEQAQKQVLQTDWKVTLNPKTIDQIQGFMKQFGLIERTIPAAEMVWQGAL